MGTDTTQEALHSAAIARVLEATLGVAPTYAHAAKHVATGDPLVLPTALLKWYEVHPLDRPVPPEVSVLARGALERGAIRVDGLGFVVLHRCGDAFYFLIVCTWKNENELWETVWYKNGDAMTEFMEYPRTESHVSTFCVWELVPVASERRSWVRFLEGVRDAEAAKVWLHEQYQGQA